MGPHHASSAIGEHTACPQVCRAVGQWLREPELSTAEEGAGLERSGETAE